MLYDFAKELGVYTIKPSYNRNVIDLNRDPKGVNLYPGAQSTELCPTSCFDFSAIYLDGQLPDEQEVQRPHQPLLAAISPTIIYSIESDATAVRHRYFIGCPFNTLRGAALFLAVSCRTLILEP